jgi:ABC-type dipeptide/oligopeptide/nickel transport system ATPase component
VVADLCDRIAVLYRGELVELAETGDLFKNPLHSYSRALVQAAAGHLTNDQLTDWVAASPVDPPQKELVEASPGHWVVL